MNSQEQDAYFAAILTDHGIRPDRLEEWFTTSGNFPAIRYAWHALEEENRGQLLIDIMPEAGLLISEQFAGFSAGEDGFEDAMQNFMATAFPVFMSALWGANTGDQVDVEEWNIGKHSYQVHQGQAVFRSIGEQEPVLPEKFYETIKNVI